MTIRELYQTIEGDYDQAIRTLRMDKLLDKHIRKLAHNGVIERLFDAGDVMDPNELFEAAHAIKGVTANLGLVKLSDAAADLTEEFRPGNARKMSDEEVKERIDSIREMYKVTIEGIQRYEETN